MIFRKISVLTLTMMLGTFAFGQRNFELGFNATNVIQNAVGLVGNSDAVIEPYTISMRFANDDNAIRIGVGGGYSTLNNQQFSTGILNQRGHHFDLAFGMEKRHQIHKKFRIFYGAEAIFSLSEEVNVFDFFISSSSFTTTTTNGEKAYALSPFFGLHFQANDWLGISTKSRLDFVVSETVQSTVDQSTGVNRGPDYTVNYIVRHNLPNSIYLYFNLNELSKLKSSFKK